MKELIDYDNKAVEFFNNDDEKISYRPDEGCTLTFKREIHRGELSLIDRFYIIHTDISGVEIERWNATSKSITYIKWKNEK